MKKTLMALSAAVALACAIPAQEIQKREKSQQERIGQGVENGSLTAKEAAKLETKEKAINQEVHADRTLNGGKLTPQEKKTVNQQQNKLSNQIYNEKHNAATALYGKSEVGQRQQNQQDRIGQGIQSGSLKPGEAAKLENKQAALNHEIRTDRQANGGKLTPQEKKTVNQQQNKLSQQIYKEKHGK
jgi:hypothetical protein